ncbi:mas-related G-protein coupled receptor member H-like [Sceloporus undulatus]|uniref:mas-related G-protein coupled receptor member H-like n=1 Tax=Sceloporus undulatus TaxID=8520 RepID=UPI001C4C9949|nr:mas-related G-protein coupled receptor member H-like [Sceloporus undulatus]XP_042320142.1 mas-related G-protein coupled receptor member H-like [Sceloporus undulatus]XP_042320143.1 mas-related G-protein coupled receptor member H-like [Sceloporus undulatus]XP_042320144.1 mas-related G-protein coupled receptor member H-like [Sceloporus undulatus]XP_042320145.1 mas-related G-protein coupled receptor member H-like [Sceloporus undulatus]
MAEHILNLTDTTINFQRPYNYSESTPFFVVAEVWALYDEISKNGSAGLEHSGDSKTTLSTYPNMNGSTGHPTKNKVYPDFNNLLHNMINSFIVLICLLGFVGNGMVIWFLGFRMKRNPFTTYILNLSIADFGVLLCIICTSTFVIIVHLYNRINAFAEMFLIFLELFFFTYSTGQFLLVAISIDRCVAVLFPLWHRCHRPPHLSTIVCALIWILSFLLSGIHFTLHRAVSSEKSPLLYQLVVNVLLCTPLMVISTLVLFIQVCCKPEQQQRRKLVTAILLSLLFFLIFALPLNVIYIIKYFYSFLPSLMVIGFGCASLNSSINPLIYFLVGRRQKKGRSRMSMKVALQRVFKDEHDTKEEQNTTSDTLV